MYESQYTPVIVNSIDGTYQSHFSSVNQQGQPLLYYNPGSSSQMESSLMDPNKVPQHFHHSHHLKSSPSASQTLPRRCSVGPLESNSQVPDGLYISFSKAPVNKGTVSLQAKNYSSPMSNAKGAHVDCLQTSSLPLESVPLLGPSSEGNNGPLEQGTHSSPKPHEICLVSHFKQCHFSTQNMYTCSLFIFK